MVIDDEDSGSHFQSSPKTSCNRVAAKEAVLADVGPPLRFSQEPADAQDDCKLHGRRERFVCVILLCRKACGESQLLERTESFLAKVLSSRAFGVTP